MRGDSKNCLRQALSRNFETGIFVFHIIIFQNKILCGEWMNGRTDNLKSVQNYFFMIIKCGTHPSFWLLPTYKKLYHTSLVVQRILSLFKRMEHTEELEVEPAFITRLGDSESLSESFARPPDVQCIGSSF